jgi:hypothetical protein
MIGALVYLWFVGVHSWLPWPVLVAEAIVLIPACWVVTRRYDKRVVARAFHRQLLEARDEVEFYMWTCESEGNT